MRIGTWNLISLTGKEIERNRGKGRLRVKWEEYVKDLCNKKRTRITEPKEKLKIERNIVNGWRKPDAERHKGFDKEEEEKLKIKEIETSTKP